MKPEVFAFSGFSGSGKTTLIEKLIPLFKEQGMKICVIKHDAHQFEMDKEGKDTYRFSKAGADSVMISSETRSARVNEFPKTLEDMIEECAWADVIIVEGYKYAKLRKIGVASERTEYHLPCDVSEYFAVVTDNEKALKTLEYYKITDKGKEQYAFYFEEWNKYKDSVDTLLGGANNE